MSGGSEFKEAAVWRRWCEAAAEAGDAAAEPDALTLAAYAEQRLGRPGSDPETDPAIAAVEAWLAGHPDALDDVAAARIAAAAPADAVAIARAQALIAQPGRNVVALSPRHRDWRNTMAWSGIAASLLAAVAIGFSLGNNNVVELSDLGATQFAEQPLLGSQTTILSTDDEESGI